MFSPADSITYDCTPKWCPHPPALSVSVTETLSPSFSRTSSRTSETRQQTSLSAAHLLFCLCPFIRRVFSLIVFLSGCLSPLSNCTQKINHNPPKGSSMKNKKNKKNQGRDTLKHTAALFPTYELTPISYKMYTDKHLYFISNVSKLFFNEH